MELGNELWAGFVSLNRFHDIYSRRLTSLYHIKLNSVDIVSHLTPIPTIFCSTSKVCNLFLVSHRLGLYIFISQDFDYVFQLYRRDSVGIEFIERGDYEVLRAEDSQIIGTFGARTHGGVGSHARDKYRDVPESDALNKVSEVHFCQLCL